MIFVFLIHVSMCESVCICVQGFDCMSANAGGSRLDYIGSDCTLTGFAAGFADNNAGVPVPPDGIGCRAFVTAKGPPGHP